MIDTTERAARAPAPLFAADPTNDGVPSPNDAPIPLPVEVPGNPSDGHARKALAEPASQEPATVPVAPDHCQHLAACASSTCPACEPRWRGMAGRAMLDYLHDDPAEFLTLFQALSEANKQETYAAIASFGGKTVEEIVTFIARSRARAIACGVLTF